MQLTDDDIREFSDIWKQEFKEEISAARARKEAGLLLDLYAVLAEPLPRDQPSPAIDQVAQHYP